MSNKTFRRLNKRSLIDDIKDMLKKRKDRQEVIEKAEKEAEQIFMKNRPDMALGPNKDYYPQTSEHTPSDYNREARRTRNQVVKTRLDQWRERRKNNSDNEKEESQSNEKEESQSSSGYLKPLKKKKYPTYKKLKKIK